MAEWKNVNIAWLEVTLGNVDVGGRILLLLPQYSRTRFGKEGFGLHVGGGITCMPGIDLNRPTGYKCGAGIADDASGAQDAIALATIDFFAFARFALAVDCIPVSALTFVSVATIVVRLSGSTLKHLLEFYEGIHVDTRNQLEIVVPLQKAQSAVSRWNERSSSDTCANVYLTDELFHE